MSDELAEEFIKAADLDGDGRIDYIGTYQICFQL